MEFIDIIHAPKEEISDFNPDLFIAGCGYESRSICIPQSLSSISGKKIALCFKEHTKEISRPANDIFYKENNYELFFYSGEEAPDFDQIFKSFDKRKLKVMIDISVMTRTWYHSILRFLHELKGFPNIILKVVYCPALYSDPVKVKSKMTLTEFCMMDNMRENSRRKRVQLLSWVWGMKKKSAIGFTTQSGQK